MAINLVTLAATMAFFQLAHVRATVPLMTLLGPLMVCSTCTGDESGRGTHDVPIPEGGATEGLRTAMLGSKSSKEGYQNLIRQGAEGVSSRTPGIEPRIGLVRSRIRRLALDAARQGDPDARQGSAEDCARSEGERLATENERSAPKFHEANRPPTPQKGRCCCFRAFLGFEPLDFTIK